MNIELSGLLQLIGGMAQVGNLSYDGLPGWLKITIAMLIGLAQLVVHIKQAYFNPDGTPAKEKYLPSSGGGSSFNSISLLLIVGLTLPVTMLQACGQSDQQKLLTGVSQVYIGLKTASDITDALNKSGKLDDQGALATLQNLNQIGLSVKTFKARVIALDTITTDNKVELGKLLDAVITDLTTLEKDGVIRIRSPEAQQNFHAALALARTGIMTVKAFLLAVKKPVKASNIPLQALPGN